MDPSSAFMTASDGIAWLPNFAGITDVIGSVGHDVA
jgi:hypothetical protein